MLTISVEEYEKLCLSQRMLNQLHQGTDSEYERKMIHEIYKLINPVTHSLTTQLRDQHATD